MNYFSTKEIAAQWGVDASLVLRLAREGRIDGTKRIGNRWLFPQNAKKPLDGRTREVKSSPDTAMPFRFPLYVNFEESDYSPPLSEEEAALRKAQIDFYACRFDEAKAGFLPLSEKAENRYVKLSALYHLLYLAIYECSPNFESVLLTLNQELSQDFPYQKEMSLLRYGFDADNISYKSLLEEFSLDSDYPYHPSAYSVLALVSFIPIENGDFSLMSKLRYDTQELLCQQMERDGHYLEAQKMHYLLTVCYQLQNDTKKTEAHIRRGLTIAMERELYFVAAFYDRWYRNPARRVLREFPPEFSEKIKSIGKWMQQKQTTFTQSRQHLSYLGILSSKEFEYAFLVNQGYTNREIAKTHKISEKTVSRIYSEIYDKLGVHNKQELIDLINGSHRHGNPELR